MRVIPLIKSLFARPASEEVPAKTVDVALRDFNGSLQLRHLDAGSCNGCEIEIGSAFAPTYDIGRFGVRLVASPRHADGILATGVVTKNMAGPLKKTFEAVPNPKIVVALGDCAIDGGVFNEAYGVAGTIGDYLEVDVEIPGCPPHPLAIVEALRALSRR